MAKTRIIRRRESVSGREPISYSRREQILAAQATVNINKALGEESEPWLLELAQANEAPSR